MQVDLETVVREVREQFDAYEQALMSNDVDALNGFFWNDSRALRFGVGEQLYGHEAIAAFRAGRETTDLTRRLERTAITAFGPDVAVANTEYVRLSSGRRGRQSQTWVRFAEGWRIVSAHVSLLS